jgi:hypothetical protein
MKTKVNVKIEQHVPDEKKTEINPTMTLVVLMPVLFVF